jgi:glutathione S-transferase
MASHAKDTVHHIPVCPFSQRLEILLELKGLHEAVEFKTVDITVPRPPVLQAKMGNTTSLPVLERADDGSIVKESLVILDLLEDRFPDPAVRQVDPARRAIENEFIKSAEGFTRAGCVRARSAQRVRHVCPAVHTSRHVTSLRARAVAQRNHR